MLYFDDRGNAVPGPKGGPRISGSHSIAVRPIRQSWYANSDWNAFTEVPVSDAAIGVTRTGANGIGIVTGTGGDGGNDRRFMVRTDFRATDMEVGGVFSIGGNDDQIGLVFRRQTGKAVVIWSNILFNDSCLIITGIWRYDGVSLFATNQMAAAIDGCPMVVLSGTSSGGTITLNTKFPHGLNVNDVIDASNVNAAFSNKTVTGTPSGLSFQFADGASGPFGSGTFKRIFMPDKLHIAGRLVSSRLTMKVWMDWEAEPNWSDDIRTSTVALPATLDDGSTPPMGPGDAGIIFAHLGTGGSGKVRDWYAISLD